jgi:hypothetical protein
MHLPKRFRRHGSLAALVLCSALFAVRSPAQEAAPTEGRVFYEALKAFDLQGKAAVSGLTLKKDRAEMVFTGDFYFAAPVNGRVTGAVFIGSGSFRAAAPPISYEKEAMARFIDTDTAESDFRTAVLRFSDDTFEQIGKGMEAGAAAPDDARKLAAELGPRLLKETGANLSARLLVSLANAESPGVFLAQFDKGSRGRFTYLVDPQTRLPGSAFGINGGEKVLLFAYAPYAYTNDLWIATYSEENFSKNQASYSDSFDLVAPLHYDMEIDVRDARKILRTRMRIDFQSLADGLRAIPMDVNEGLTEFDNIRLDEAMRVTSARYGGKDIACIQEDWESGLTILLPKAMKKGEAFSVEVALEGDFIDNQDTFLNCYYPQDNNGWYPKHGYLKRSTFNALFRHDKNDRVASIGKLVREGTWPDSSDGLTEFRMETPVSFISFAAGKLVRHTDHRKLQFGEIDLDFYSVPSSVSTVKEEFILAEMGNILNYFSEYFGAYPYPSFKATIHPFNFGQGFPTLLMIPRADEANYAVFSFIAHETAHQWWGNIVAWRSYRDQWLSEGFAEYSGMLYTGFRDSMKNQRELIDDARYVLPFPPKTDRGVGKEKLAEIGPLILGQRLSTRKTMNVYSDLIYNKGAMVLRMLHFLLSDPNTGSGQPFFDMMSDFVKQYQNRAATTEDFMRVAGAHFANAPLGRMFGLKDLNWFFQQWVFEAKLPSYRMEYRIDQGDNDSAVITGTLFQENAGPNWFMPLPVVFKFPGDQMGRAAIYANGPETAFKIPLPMKPSSVALDPDLWILSEKTSTKKK